MSQEEAYRLKEIIKQIMLNKKCYVNMWPICGCCYGCSGCVCVRAHARVCVFVIMKSARDSAYTDSIIGTVLLMLHTSYSQENKNWCTKNGRRSRAIWHHSHALKHLVSALLYVARADTIMFFNDNNCFDLDSLGVIPYVRPNLAE